MEVRSKGDSGKLLFAWNPDSNTVEIVKCGEYYRIKLFHSLQKPFLILDHHPYAKHTDSKSNKEKDY